MAKNAKILENVYSIRDIQIFGAGSRRMKEVDETNRNVNHASFWLTVHRRRLPHSRTSLYISPES